MVDRPQDIKDDEAMSFFGGEEGDADQSQDRPRRGLPARFALAFAMSTAIGATLRCRIMESRVREMKYRTVHLLQKFLLNPPIKLLFALGIAPPGYALLETTGRKTAKRRRSPVGDGRIGNQF